MKINKNFISIREGYGWRYNSGSQAGNFKYFSKHSEKRVALAVNFFDAHIDEAAWPIYFKSKEDCLAFLNMCVDLGFSEKNE